MSTEDIGFYEAPLFLRSPWCRFGPKVQSLLPTREVTQAENRATHKNTELDSDLTNTLLNNIIKSVKENAHVRFDRNYISHM